MPKARDPRRFVARATALVGLVALVGALSLSAMRVADGGQRGDAPQPARAAIEQVAAHHPLLATAVAVTHRVNRNTPLLVALLVAFLGLAMAGRSFMLAAAPRPRRARSVVVEPGASRAPPVVVS